MGYDVPLDGTGWVKISCSGSCFYLHKVSQNKSGLDWFLKKLSDEILFSKTKSSNKDKTNLVSQRALIKTKIQVMAGCDNPGHCLGGCIGNPDHYKLVIN